MIIDNHYHNQLKLNIKNIYIQYKRQKTKGKRPGARNCGVALIHDSLFIIYYIRYMGYRLIAVLRYGRVLIYRRCTMHATMLGDSNKYTF